MKPIVVEKNREGKIILTQEQLEKMLLEAYEEGVKDGNSSSVPIIYPSYPQSPYYYGTGTPWWVQYPYEITCSSDC